ncbi:MAG TPA: FAD-dependent monooxygenase [Sphingomonadaceae bacterium]|nr:FAD-dependent monooxygenase [Sphingomonadaceae bacterium]
MASDTIIDTPVLIVGAGPIGLCMAMELGWRGIECTIIDKGDGSIDLPRGAMVSARTMEFCRRWGIADRVARAGFPQDYALNMVYCTSLTGHLLERDDFPAEQDRTSPPESPERRVWCPQLQFDPMIARAVAERPNVTMRYGHELLRFEDGPDHIVAHCRAGDGAPRTIRARYMIACDGAASFVRQEAGIELDGRSLGYSVNIFFRAPTLLASHDKGEAERYLFLDETGTWGNITVVNGKDQWRLTVMAGHERVDMAAFDAEFYVRKAMGRDDIPFELIAVKPWRRSEYTARQFRVGRLMLAGDAAHTMSPTGGFGMNTGVIDAVNLGWKVQAMLEGWGGDALLDSYGAEQVPVVKRNAASSTTNFRLWTGVRELCGPLLLETPEGAEARRKVGALLKESLREEWECLGIQLGYRYEASPLCVPDGTPPTPDEVSVYVPTSRPGARAPHAWLADGRSTLDLFGRGFVLLRFGAPDGASLVAAARARGVPIETVAIDDPAIAALYERALVLVRPDGHVVWRGDRAPKDADRVIDVARGAGGERLATAEAA